MMHLKYSKLKFNHDTIQTTDTFSKVTGGVGLFANQGLDPDPGYAIELPSNLNAMISLAERLSEGIPFLRVDFYNINGAIYFGELTFYPASGMLPWTTDEADVAIGNYLKL